MRPADVWGQPMLFAPSLISCCDLCNLEASARRLEAMGAPLLHVDILDGHFSPSMPLGLDTVRQLRARTALPFDCHVMATANGYFVDELLDIGAQQITFHVETEPHVDALLTRVKKAGARAGLALKPSTPLTALDYVLEKCDAVLLMLINPGYAFLKDEKQVPYGPRKVADLRRLIDGRGLGAKIAIDGRVSRENVAAFGRAVDIYVAGSTCLRKGDLEGDFAALSALRAEKLGARA